jgi:hypothetical protein
MCGPEWFRGNKKELHRQRKSLPAFKGATQIPGTVKLLRHKEKDKIIVKWLQA